MFWGNLGVFGGNRRDQAEKGKKKRDDRYDHPSISRGSMGSPAAIPCSFTQLDTHYRRPIESGNVAEPRKKVVALPRESATTRLASIPSERYLTTINRRTAVPSRVSSRSKYAPDGKPFRSRSISPPWLDSHLRTVTPSVVLSSTRDTAPTSEVTRRASRAGFGQT